MNKKFYNKFFFLVLIFLMYRDFGKSAVTYTFSWGRFGDRLMSYVHAKWISYKYDFQLLYKPFMFSDQLVLSERERLFKQRDVKSFKHVVSVPKGEQISFDGNNILYIIPYFSEYLKNKNGECKRYLVTVDWSDECFLQILRAFIQPKMPLKIVRVPKNCITVAIHIRTGGGYDRLLGERQKTAGMVYSDVGFPLNHPRDEFYIKQIKKVSELFFNKSIYLYIFTDDLYPQRILSKYKKSVDKPNITFDCRKNGNRHDRNVLEDFFSMQQFDCIIRPNSNYSVIAAKMGYNWLTIFPVDYKWDGNKLIMTQTKSDVKEGLLRSFISRGFLSDRESAEMMRSLYK